MLLNQMRSEDSNAEVLLRQSFHQYQCDRALPKLQVAFFCFSIDLRIITVPWMLMECVPVVQKRVKDMEEERQNIVIEEEDQVKDYRSLLQQVHSLRADIRSIAFAPRYSLPYLQPGQLTTFFSFA